MATDTKGIKIGDVIEWTDAYGSNRKSGTVAQVNAFSVWVNIGDKVCFVPCCLIGGIENADS